VLYSFLAGHHGSFIHQRREVKMRTKHGVSPCIALLLLAAGLLAVSCGKKAQEQPAGEGTAETGAPVETPGKSAEEAGPVEVAADDTNESDEDLLSVDYSEFYDELAPHGKWIRVKANEIGLTAKGGASPQASAADTKTSIWERLSPIGTAHAQAEASASASFSAEADFYVWVPSPELYVSAGAGAEAAVEAGAKAEAAVETAAKAEVAATAPVAAGAEVSYTPFANGQWVYTDAGWYFKAATPAEEITSHYGRWSFSGSLGWVWLPGRVWSPAWVEWREDADFVAWTPVPPQVYFKGGALASVEILDDSKYVIVEKKHFIDPDIYKYHVALKAGKTRIMIKEMTRHDGVMIKGKMVVDLGPDVADIQTKTGKTFGAVKIVKADVKGKARFGDGEFVVYTPKFTKVKVVGPKAEMKGAVKAPKAFVKFDEAGRQRKAGKLFVDVKGKGGADLKVKVKGKGGEDVNVKVKAEKAKAEAKAKGGVGAKLEGLTAGAKVKSEGKAGVSVGIKGKAEAGAEVKGKGKAEAGAKGKAGGKKGGKK
jgi:hypothetical protein